MRVTVVVGLVLLWSSITQANVEVMIVDHPPEVLRYGPVFVTGTIKNRGTASILVPADERSANAYFVETRRQGEPFQERLQFDASVIQVRVVWLKPGASWLFRVDVQPWLLETGTYEVRVGLRGDGECVLKPTGQEDHPVIPVPHATGVQRYECWAGENRSEAAVIKIIEPDSQVDLDALAFVWSREFPVDIGSKSRTPDSLLRRLQFGHAEMLKRFPTSHYTYVGGLYGSTNCPQCLEQLLNLQPSHLLGPYTRLQWGLALLSSGRSAEVTGSFVEGLGLPDTLAQYLTQRRQEVIETEGAANGRSSSRTQ